MHDDPWAKIEASTEVVGLRVQGRHPLNVYWTRRQDGAVGLQFRAFPARSLDREVPRLREVSIDLRNEEPAFLALFLDNQLHQEMFHLLCRDIIEASSRSMSPERAISEVFRRLNHWQSMLAIDRTGDLSDQEVRGLLGELTVLGLIAEGLGIEGAVAAWVAPDEQPQDFALPFGLLEVKTRLASSRQVVTVSSLEQLDARDTAMLLVVVECSPDEKGVSLNELVESFIEQAERSSWSLRNRLELALLRRGYVYSPSYDAKRYRASMRRAFLVREGFPRLRRSSCDTRIRSASYCIDITALDEFEVDVDSGIAALYRSENG